MNFSTPEAVESVIQTCLDAETRRATNRALINELFNGYPPFTEQEAIENGITVNIDWREGTNLAWSARRQFENAFLKPKNFFTVTLESGPVHKKMAWGKIITRNINRILKRSRPYLQLHRSKWAGVVLHGTGAQYWGDDFHWCPKFVAVEDLMIPTDTTCDLENLPYFDIEREYTIGELFRMTHGKFVDPGWNMEEVNRVLKDWKNLNTNNSTYDAFTSPEKWAELMKQNLAYWEADKAPSVKVHDFYYLEDDDQEAGWYRKMLLASGSETSRGAKFIYDGGKKKFSDNLGQLLHIQFGDGNNKPPFLYHSVRSLGFLLYDVCQMSNILRCRMAQHIHESLMQLFRVNDPADRDRAKVIRLASTNVLEPGLEIVPRDQRHQVDAGLLQISLNNYKQLMSESAATYTQQSDNRTDREETATAAMAKIQQLNALTSSMLAMSYRQEQWAYEEICRRFCLEKAGDKDVEEFRRRCLSEGVDPKALDSARWQIEPEQVLGAGNKTLELGQVDRLMAVRNLHHPEAQMEILHRYDEAVTDDPNLAELLSPTEKAPHVTDAVHDAELSFATMMLGVQVQPKPGLNQIEQVETLLKMASAVVDRINQTGGVGTQEDVIGLQSVSQNIKARIQLIAQDPNEKQKVKLYMDLLGEIDNQVKAFAQRQAEEAQKQQPQVDPETIVKLKGKQMEDQQKLQSKEAQSAQKLRQKEVDFAAGQRRKNVETGAKIAREKAVTKAQLANDAAKTAGSLFVDGMQGAAEAGRAANEPEPATE